ncbi:MAG: phosphate signaling complex protein PhoU [Mariprofundus sp.]|nr:phosphate signaling complex protein PhoU [Mariprofundus sp.]
MQNKRPEMTHREAVKSQIMQMAKEVELVIVAALRVWRECDHEQAQHQVEKDLAINVMQADIEEACVIAIARFQPVAVDLRDLISDIHIAEELERIADLAADICKTVADKQFQALPSFTKEIDLLGQQCSEQLANIIQAYADSDEPEARKIAALDKTLDRSEKNIIRDIMAYAGEHPDAFVICTHALWITHGLERIGDRITNIAERIVYVNTAKVEKLNHQ